MKRLLLALLLTSCSGAIHAENDLFTGLHSNSDQYFTHGTKFSYFPKQENENEKETYSLGQNIYTPSVEYTRSELVRGTLEKDRPYAGWLYGEYRRSEIKSEKIRDTFGAQVGCTGACSGARQTQQEFHRLINQRVPLWDPDYTLRTEWGAILEAEREYRLKEWEHADISATGLLRAGNLVDSAGVNLSIRSGYGLERFPSEPIIFKVPRSKNPWSAYVFASAESRVVLWNYFLQGSMFHNRDPHTVDPERFVQEGNIGFTVGYKNFKLTYRYTAFSSEWKEKPGSFTFGGITVEW